MMRDVGWPIAIAVSAAITGWLSLNGSDSPVRPLFAYWFLLVCPGMAFIRLLHVRDALAELTLSIALSIALGVAVTEIMLYANVWATQRGLFSLIALSLAGVVLQVLQMTYQSESRSPHMTVEHPAHRED